MEVIRRVFCDSDSSLYEHKKEKMTKISNNESIAKRKRQEIIDRTSFYDNIFIGNLRARRLTLFGGANPPDKREEGDANVCYIFGSDPDRYLLGIPCRFVLCTLQGKTKIAAITANNDGCL